MIKTRIVDDRREFHCLEKSIAIRFAEGEHKQEIIKRLEGKAEKLTFKYSVIDKKEKMEVDHHKSPFTMDV